MIYMVCFTISIYFIWLGTKQINKVNMKNGKWIAVRPKLFYTTVGILVPCVLAALRDTSVGSDVSFYVLPYFNRACNASSFWSYTVSLGSGGSDISYNLINYTISRISNNIGWLFFMIEGIILIFVFGGCWNLRARAYPWLSMLYFYLIFFNVTLSTVRQSCACAISFYALTLAIKNKFDKRKMLMTIGLILFAMTFHATAFFSFLILVIIYGVVMEKLKPIHICIGSLVLCIILKYNSNFFLKIVFSLVSIINSKYANQTSIAITGWGASGYTLLVLTGVLLILLLYRLIIVKDDNYWRQVNIAFLCLNVIYVCAMSFISNFVFIPRTMYYIQIFWNIPFAQSSGIVKNDRFNKLLMFMLTLGTLMFYWIYYYYIGGVHGTFPYVLRY